MARLNAPSVLIAAGFTPEVDFSALRTKTGVQLQWFSAEPQPSDTQIDDWATGTTPLPNGQLFTEWSAEHGGDPVKTRKRRAREELSKSDQGALLMEVAVAVVLGVLDVVRTQVPTIPDPTPAQVRDRLKTRIGS